MLPHGNAHRFDCARTGRPSVGVAQALVAVCVSVCVPFHKRIMPCLCAQASLNSKEVNGPCGTSFLCPSSLSGSQTTMKAMRHDVTLVNVNALHPKYPYANIINKLPRALSRWQTRRKANDEISACHRFGHLAERKTDEQNRRWGNRRAEKSKSKTSWLCVKAFQFSNFILRFFLLFSFQFLFPFLVAFFFDRCWNYIWNYSSK